MLKKLYVENYALIDKLDLEWSNSLNIITGETGAGKSILLGALGLLLGNRGEAAAIKDQQRNCVVEGVFEIGDYGLEDFFTQNELDYDRTAIIRRVIAPGGKSRAYINDLPVQVITLREFGSHLIDIHSQHQSLMLTEDGFRINILDSVAGSKDLAAEYSKVYHTMRSTERELERMCDDADRSRQDQEWLSFQATQLSEAKLKEGEQEELEALQNELSHAQEIKQALSVSAAYLTEDETGILSRLKAIEQNITHIKEYYQRSEELGGRIRSTLLELRDIEQEVSSQAERVDSDPVQLQKTDDRLNTLYSLQQKHKVSKVAELIALQNDYEHRLAAIVGGNEAITETKKRIAALKTEATQLAAKITKERISAGIVVTKYVEQMLDSLGMPGSKFVVDITATECLRSTGADNIRFLFSANKNIAPAPVEKIASGGEISRVMLALKSLVAKSSKLPTIIFDEIDAGVSGRIADAMGNIINELSQSMQVINITHLPQAASKGQTHFYVYKDTESATARTMIRLLNSDERVEEIANMLSGSTTTQAALLQARLLLGLEK